LRPCLPKCYIVHMSNPPIGAAEAARILGLSHSGLRRLIDIGTLPAHKLPGRTGAYVLERDAVEALAKQRDAA
jgi:excisionase family DNA binding protein